MTRKQRQARHGRRRRHAASTRSAPGAGQQAGSRRALVQLGAGKQQPAQRRLRTVHDMAAAAMGRDDLERAWRRAFKGVHSIGYKSDGSPSSAGGLQKASAVPRPAGASGAVKRRWRGRRRLLDPPAWVAFVETDLGAMPVRITPLALRINGWYEVRPGQWRSGGWTAAIRIAVAERAERLQFEGTEER